MGSCKHIVHLKVDDTESIDIHLLCAPGVLQLLWTHVERCSCMATE